MAAATATPSAASSWVDTLGAVLWESKRIVAAHTRHFLALSVLFLLPLSLLLVAAPSFASPLFRPDPLLPPHETLLRGAPRPSGGGALAVSLGCAVVAAAVLSLCAVAAVTRGVRDGFFGRPVRIAAALRSLPSSLWRLLLTSLAASVVLVAYAAILASIFLLCLRVLPFVGLHHLTPSAFCTAATAVLVLGAVYLQVNWALAGAVAVAESSWGFDPLRRSAHLVRGMRWGVLCLALFFSVAIGSVLWFADQGVAVEVEGGRGVAPVVARVVFASAVTVVLLVYSLVCTTVLYIYCKALHGELAGEIAEEFAREYVCLPFDDRKVPHIVSVVWQ